MKNASGFTLVEMIVTVLLIGIMITVLAWPSYLHSQERALCAEAMHTLETFREGVIAYSREYNTFRTDPDNNSSSFITRTDVESFISTSLEDTTQWTYTLAFADDENFTVTALRAHGIHQGASITVDQTDHWTGDYPFDDPGAI